MRLNMFFLSLFFCLATISLTAQNYFRQSFDAEKRHILLANPTVSNIRTINYLVENNIFNVDLKKTQFVGVYYEKQEYNFSATANFIKDEKLTHFALHEVRGVITMDDLYRENSLSRELRNLFDHSAGIIFFGGADIPPEIYGEKNTLSYVTTPERHKFETTFLFHLLGGYRNEAHIPFLEDHPEYMVTGFCLGMQTMNVATGGTLIQDIPFEIYGAETAEATVLLDRENIHRNYWQKITKDTLLMSINFHSIQFTGHPFFGKRVKVPKNSQPLIYSSHHQAVEKPGKGMEITAVSPDGQIVEALAHTIYPHVFAVQFHPEITTLYKDDKALKFHPDDEPATYHKIIGKKGLKFHKNYWKYISKSFNIASKSNPVPKK